mgnify:CR=1
MNRALLALLLGGLARSAYAEDKTVTVSAKDAGKAIVLPAPEAGENLNVIVEVPVPTSTKTVPVPVLSKSNISLRGGIGWSYFTNSEGIAWTGDLVGQVGFRSSPWRVRARLGFGEARYNTRALSGSLAIMWRFFETNWHMGVSVDGLATIDKNTHPLETVEEQFGGVSGRIAFEQGNFLLEGFVSWGAHGTRAPGDTPEELGVFGGGVTLSYMWGR